MIWKSGGDAFERRTCCIGLTDVPSTISLMVVLAMLCCKFHVRDKMESKMMIMLICSAMVMYCECGTRGKVELGK